MGSTNQDFQSLVGNFEEQSDAFKNLEVSKEQAKERKSALEGSELLNVVGTGGLGILGRAVERANLSGRITKNLDEFQSGLGPIGSRVLGVARKVGSDLLGSTEIGSAISKALAPSVPEDAPSLPQGKVSVSNEMVPALRSIGRSDLADRLLSEQDSGTLTKGTLNDTHDALSQSQNPQANEVAGRMRDAVSQARLSKVAQQNDRGLDESTIRPVEPTGNQPRLDVPESTIAPPTMTSYQSIPRVEGEDTDFGVGGRPVKPSVIQDDEFGGDSGVVSGVTQIVGLAGGNVRGPAGQALGLGAIGGQAVSDLAEGEVPTGALVAGAQAALGDLGTRGRDAVQGIGLGVTAGQVGSGVKNIASRIMGTSENLQQAGETAARNITEADAPDTLSGIGDTIVGAASKAANSGLSSVVGTLGELTEESAVTDEDPISIGITAGLGLLTGLVGIGEGISDIVNSDKPRPAPIISIPSFQSGVN